MVMVAPETTLRNADLGLDCRNNVLLHFVPLLPNTLPNRRLGSTRGLNDQRTH